MQFPPPRLADDSVQCCRVGPPRGGDVATSHGDRHPGGAQLLLQNSSREGEGKAASRRSSHLALISLYYSRQIIVQGQ